MINVKGNRRTKILMFVAISLVGAGGAWGQELKRSGFLGLRVVPVSDASPSQGRSSQEAGVRVQGLVDGGSAQSVDIQANDIITQIDDRKVNGVAEFLQEVRSLHAGDLITLHIIRANQTLTKALTVRPRPYEYSSDADIFYKGVDSNGNLRRVIVTAPKQAGRHPAVLYLTGIGCFSQEDPTLTGSEAKLLYGLTRAGFVTMRVEKTGIGDSQGPACSSSEASMLTEVQGYLAGLRALKQYPFVDPANVFIVGLSIGGVEAPQVARQEPVKGLVVINTVAKPFFEYLLDTRRRQMLLRQVPYDEVERRMKVEESCNHRFLIERENPDQLLSEDPACLDAIDYPAPFTYMQQWAELNIANEWKQVDKPVLIVYGSSDFVSSIGDDPYLAEMIDSFHPGKATLKAVAGMDHYMTRASSMKESISRKPGDPTEFEPSALETIKAWLQPLAASKGGP